MKTHYCRDCEHDFNAPKDLEERLAFLCPACKSDNWCLTPGRMPGLFGDQHDFSREKDPTTGKDGRYMPQMARYPGDPRAVVRHVDNVIEYGKRKGYTIERH